MKALINKETLKVICEAKGVSARYLSSKCSVNEATMLSYLTLESEELPAFGKAKDIAKKLHVPFAGLYMDSALLPIPSIKKHRITSYRSIGIIDDDSIINLAVCDLIEARNALFRAFDEIGREKPETYIFAPSGDSPSKWAQEIRGHFGISMDYQIASQNTRQFFLYVRRCIEDKGIFVGSFSGVPVEVMRGVAIYEKAMPIIGINFDDRYPGKIFSMIHELVHLLKRESATCNEMFSPYNMSKEEVFCNAVAGEMLVPSMELKNAVKKYASSSLELDGIECLSKHFSVSREVITRRLLDCGYIMEDEYDAFMKEIKKQFIEERDRRREESRQARADGRPTGFPKRQELVAIDRNSSAYCNTLFTGFCNEVFTKRDVARSLGIKEKHIDKFIKEVSKWVGR